MDVYYSKYFGRSKNSFTQVLIIVYKMRLMHCSGGPKVIEKWACEQKVAGSIHQDKI